jgi:hypothetical protein
MLERVVYRPGKESGFGQAFRIRNVRGAAASLSQFLTSCTTSRGPEDLQLVAHRATEWDDETVADAVIARVTANFGSADTEKGLGYIGTSGRKLQGGELTWNFKSEELPRLVEFISSKEPWPRQTLAAVAVHARFVFQWRDPDSGVALPGQDTGNATSNGRIQSSLFISLGRSQFAQPHFWFPYPEGAPKLSSFLHRAAGLIPFNLNRRHFRAAIPNSDGSGYSFRKIIVPPEYI